MSDVFEPVTDINLTQIEKKTLLLFFDLKRSKASVILIGAQKLSNSLELSRPRAYAILSKLVEKEILEKIDRKGFTLTKYGHRVVNELIHRMKILETYLYQELEMKPLERAEKEALQMVLCTSYELIEILCKKLDKPEKCPHDIKIPHHDHGE